MLEVGFLSDKAPLFMDIVSVFFIILPFLLLISFNYIKNNQIKSLICNGLLS